MRPGNGLFAGKHLVARVAPVPDPDQARREPQESKQQKCVEQQVVPHLSFPLLDR
jgi:hypothetical protein